MRPALQPGDVVVTQRVPIGYPAVWLQSGGRGMLAITLGAMLLIAAAVTILRPGKPTKPHGIADSADSAETAETADRSGEPLEAATR